MGWITAIASIIKAMPEIWKLVSSLMAEVKKAKARGDWDDFEDRFKNEKENPNP